MYKICPICNKEFDIIKGSQKYCSKECIKKRSIIQRKNWNNNHKKENSTSMKKYRKNHKERIKIKAKQYYSTPPGIYNIMIFGAKQRNLECNIAREDFLNWYTNQEQKCYYCQRILEKIKQDTFGHNSRLTIDRIDNNKGYELNNIKLACFRCNSIKSDYFTESEMLKIGKIIKNKEMEIT